MAYTQRLPKQFVRAELERFNSDSARLLLAEGVRTVCFAPLITRERVLGTIGVASLRDTAFPQEDVDLLSQVAAQVAIAVENALAFEQIAELKNKLAEEKLYLEDEIRTEYIFEEIIGESPLLNGAAQCRCKRSLQQARPC